MKNKIIPYSQANTPDLWSPDKCLQYSKIINSFDMYDVPEDQQQWILEALHDNKTWNWYENCNGANLVSEPGWPVSKVTQVAYSPPYVYHDYAWSKWGPTMKSNNRMKILQDTYRMDFWRSWLRWGGVTFFGAPVYWVAEFFRSKRKLKKFRKTILK